MNQDCYRRLRELEKFGKLENGPHEEGGGICIMEAVAFVAGEKWSDTPECACPIISEFLRVWNDDLPDDKRDGLLRPLISRIIGTRSTPDVERKRALLVANWFIREFIPPLFLLAKLDTVANALELIADITDVTQIIPIRDFVYNNQHNDTLVLNTTIETNNNYISPKELDETRKTVWEMIEKTAMAATEIAIWQAAEDNVVDAVRDAIWDLLGEATFKVAITAIRNGAKDKVLKSLMSICDESNKSTLRLVDRMIICK